MIDIRRNPPLDLQLRTALVDLWLAVTRAGGAVGFAADATADEVRAVADPAFEQAAAGVDDLVIALDGSRPVGMGFLETNRLALHRHWATVKRLQRHPEASGRGVGAAVLQGLEDAARNRGLDRIVLAVRGRTGRENFYLAHGYGIEARLPERIMIVPGDLREELVLTKSLNGVGGPTLSVQRLDPQLPLPSYAHPGDAGLDLHARVDVELAPGERAVVPTGIAVALPPGCVGLVHPRSGLAARHGVALVNSPGTIDEGYRGEIKVIAVNLDRDQPVRLQRGDRIAQLVIQRVETVNVVETAELDATGRGEGGFGSSGR